MLTQLSKRRDGGDLDLVDLLSECHQRIRHFIALARRAAATWDAPIEQIEQACADVERYFSEALPLHVADEEKSVEPRLRGLSLEADHALDTMAHQHHEHGPSLLELLRAAQVVRNDPRDPGARAELGRAAQALDVAFEEHLALEEQFIFPAIRCLLSRETHLLIMNEIRQRRRFERVQTTTVAAAESRA